MKKALAFFVVLLLIASLSVSAYGDTSAEKKTFDYTVFEKYSNYQYDKFEDYWYYYEAYMETFSDAYVIIGIDVGGVTTVDDNINTPTMYVKVLDTDIKPLAKVKRIDFIVDDDTKYTYEKMLETDDASTIWFATQGKQLVEAIANSKSISAKITMEHNSIKFDLDQNQVDNSLKVICKALLENNVWDYLAESSNKFEEVFPLTIKK